MIKFVNYQKEYYQTVCDFLIELNKEDNLHSNWNWARFEWMYEHPSTNKDLLKYMGLWFDDNHLIGVALIDMYFGEAFVATLKDYQYLYSEILDYAFNNLKDDQGLGISINNLNQKEIKEVLKQGFYKEEAEEYVFEIKLDKKYQLKIPDGFVIEEFDAEENQEDISWLMWQGFDHGDNKEQFLKDFTKNPQKRPHFNKSLCIVIKNKDSDLVASASSWYHKNTDYAYVEPVCVIPQYRKLGLGTTAVLSSLNNAMKLGAARAIVVSNQEFYKKIGFKEAGHYSFYRKKEEKIVNGKVYKIEKLLGKGKGGYSCLVKFNDKEYVLKQIHHEPCDYYQFGNKIETERNDYRRLLEAGIRIPKMIDIDLANEIIIKEYIDGDVISDLIKEGKSVDVYIPQLIEMARLAKEAGLNIDYYPTNFVIKNGELFYIDYECNQYMEEWNLENWGMKYWNNKNNI